MSAAYKLRFSIGSRTLLAPTLNLVHINALGRASTDSFHEQVPSLWSQDVDGYLLHSVSIAGKLPDIAFPNGRIEYLLQRYFHYRADMTTGFEDFLQKKSSKTRSTLKRKVKKFTSANKAKTLEWGEYRTPPEIDEFFTLALPLAQATYQAKRFQGALPDSEAFKEHAADLAAAGQLRAYLLFLDQRPVAYLYSPLECRTAVYAYLGYDAEIAGLSPGTVLQYLVHERLFSDPDVDWFDFTEGDGAHKALFATEKHSCINVLCVSDTWRNRILIRCHYCWNRAIETGKRLLERQTVARAGTMSSTSSGKTKCSSKDLARN